MNPLSILAIGSALALGAGAGAQTISPIGALAPATAASEPTIARSMPVVIDVSQLRVGAAAGATIAFPLTSGGTVEARVVSFEAHDGGRFLAVARGEDGTVVHLAGRGAALAGSVLAPDGTVFQIRTGPGESYEVRAMNAEQFAPCGTGDGQEWEFTRPARPISCCDHGANHAGTMRAHAFRGSAPCVEDGSSVDVLVCYTDAAAVAEGGTPNMLALIDLAILETNQSLANSNVATTIRLVGAVEIPKTWSTTSSATLLDHMANPSSGTLDEIHALRDQHHADLVSIMMESVDVCGRAYLSVGPGPTPLPELGFNLVNAACAAAPSYTMAHELAHNFGLTHERAADACDANPTPFAHAYAEPGGAFKTILCASGGGIPHFSNPNVSYMGMPTGIAGDADNAASFAVAAPFVAGFRSLDCNANGICDADEIAGGADDLDGNGLLDECEADLNNNGVVDAFDISSGASDDLNANAIPDEAEPARIYVDQSATGSGLGDSWGDARTDLQQALGIAHRSGGLVQEVWVAAGLYTPAPAPLRAVPFQLVSGVEVYGGFAGTETDLSERDWRANPTILSGDLLGDDGPDFANNGDNSVSVVWASYTDDSALLDGFTIRGGNCGYDTSDCWFSPYSGGGGIRCFAGDAVFRNCTIEGNTAQSGGGAYVVHTGSPDFLSCDFIGNAAFGYLLGATGGAMSLSANHDGEECRVENCRFLGNYSDQSGGAVTNICQDGTFLNCLFAHNVSRVYGGGAMNNSGSCGSNPTIVNCTFAYNIALDATGGVALRNFKSAPIVSNCIFWGNARDSPQVDEYAQIGAFSSSYAFELNSCIVQGWSGVHPGANSFGADPLFADPDGPDGIPGTADDDFSLLTGSPAIDSGDNALLLTPMTTDVAGNPRRADDPGTTDNGTPANDAPYVDRGALEFQSAAPPLCPGDIDGDHDTDVFDFGEFLIGFGDSGLAPFTGGDLDGDGDVDVFDFGVFLIDFGCPE